jgi:hypothetical protein
VRSISVALFPRGICLVTPTCCSRTVISPHRLALGEASPGMSWPEDDEHRGPGVTPSRLYWLGLCLVEWGRPAATTCPHNGLNCRSTFFPTIPIRNRRAVAKGQAEIFLAFFRLLFFRAIPSGLSHPQPFASKNPGGIETSSTTLPDSVNLR